MKYLAKNYVIKGISQVQIWVNTYKEFGEEGLLCNQKNKNYSIQFKLDTIELYLTTNRTFI